MRQSLLKATLAVCACSLPLLGASPAPPSAQEFYTRALEQMRRHPVPAFATFYASVTGLNCTFAAGTMNCTLGRSTPQSEKPFPVDLRQSDGRVAIHPESKPIVLGDSTFLNPTWPGVDAIIRRGFTGMGTAPAPTPMPSPSGLPVIAVVSALSAGNYNVYDAGAAMCASGNPGHAVRMSARSDPRQYPLTGATVDMKTGDLCSVRFNAKAYAAAGLVGATGGVYLDFKNAGCYEVVSNERFSIDLRAIGISVRHLDVDVRYSDFSFPKEIDPSVFVTPSPKPAKSP